VAHPQIAVFARLAEGNKGTVRRIEGQKTFLTRTMHAIHYNEVRDEIVVPNQFAQAVLTFRGAASGEEPPIRVIQGSRTQLEGSSGVVIDTKNNEIITERFVFPIDANGNVAPSRTLKYSVAAVDTDNDLYVSTRDANGGTQLLIFDRKSDSDRPLRVIGGPKTMLVNPSRIRVQNGWILVAHDGVQTDNPNNLSFVGVWSVNDNGDVPPRWTFGGPNQMLVKPRGVDVDPKNQTVIVTDKELNAVLTYHAPEVFREPGARARFTEDTILTAGRDSASGRVQTLWHRMSDWLQAAAPHAW